MTKRPAPKSMTLVTYYDIASRKIQFYADKYVVGDLEEYGVFLSSLDGYVLRVDPRYDFNEVLWYVRNYGEPEQSPQQETRYDWSDVPEKARFMATDPNGDVWAYEKNPKPGKNSWFIAGGDIWLISEPSSNWKDSLEERPQ